MLKMIDVLDQRLVQNFTQALQSPTPQFEEQLDQGILNASDLELNHAVTAFFNEVNAIEAAQDSGFMHTTCDDLLAMAHECAAGSTPRIRVAPDQSVAARPAACATAQPRKSPRSAR